MYKLRFNQSLATSATKPIQVNELLKRLKALSIELEAIDQENVDRTSFNRTASDLASNNILHHKNKGVTAYASCCIADLLRICAPDAPFSQTQLKSIFECFIKQFRGLGDIEGTYYSQHYYLLESLASVESVVLLGDIDKGDSLIVDMFRTFFDTSKDDSRRKNVEDHMINIMVQILQELPSIPSEVLEIMLAQFIRVKNQSQHAFVRGSASYDMSKAVFNACADQLQRSVCQYFTDIIFEASQQAESSDEAGPDDARLRTAHDLVCELFSSAPSTLQNVIPQLESELNVDTLLCRTLATETISKLLASSNGVQFVQQFPAAYKAWSNRRNDKAAAIRAKWTEGIGEILASSSGAIRRGDFEKLCVDGLVTKLVDADERVRSLACKAIQDLEYEIAKARLTTGLLKTFSDRCRDKKRSIQEAAFGYIGKLFDSAYQDISSGDQVALEKFGPLVNHVLHCLYVNDPGLNVLLEQTLFEDILKCSEQDDTARARRLLQVLSLTDDKGRRAFFAIIGLMQKSAAHSLSLYLTCCDQCTGTSMTSGDNILQKKRLDASINKMTQKLPSPSGAAADMHTLAQASDKRLFKSIADAINPENDFHVVQKGVRDAIKRTAQIAPPTVETLRMLLRKASYQVLNRSVVEPISSLSTNGPEALALPAQLILSEISNVHPTIYKGHVAPLIAQITKSAVSVPVDVVKAMAHFARAHPSDVSEGASLSKATDILMRSGSPEHAKHATTIVCSLPGREKAMSDILAGILDNLVYGSDHFLTSLSVIAQVSHLAPELIEDRANEITSFCAKELLMKNRTKRVEGETDEWVDDIEDESRAKCYAIRILGNRLRAYHASPEATELARPVFKALRSIIMNMGELSKDEDTPLRFRSRLRLEAAKMVLKLAALPVYERLITAEDFVQVALFAQDLEFHVRKAFLARLAKSLSSRSLTPRWHAIMFLAAHDPEDDIRNDLRSRATNLASQHRGKDYLMESMMPRLIHLLAHHPDFAVADRNNDDIVSFSVYFEYYFEAVVTAESLVIVYHYCQRVKQVADILAHSTPDANNIYILSDIAQIVVRSKAEQHGWPLLAYPKKLKMPTDLYCAANSKIDVNLKQTHSFLDDDQIALIKARLARSARQTKVTKNKAPKTDEIHTPKKRPTSGAALRTRKRRRDQATSSPPEERRSSARKKSKIAIYRNETASSDIGDSGDESGEDSDQTTD